MNLHRRTAWDHSYELKKLKKVIDENKPPVFGECVIGFRQWAIDAFGRLRPLSVDARPWQPGINEATCDVDHVNGRGLLRHGYPFGENQALTPHAAPGKTCQCGLYAYFELSHLSPLAAEAWPEHIDGMRCPPVIGAVAAWGDLRVHHDGFRAEKACITALAVTDGMPSMVRELVEWTARPYRVPCVDIADLEREASLHGAPIPDDFRPPKAPDPTAAQMFKYYHSRLGGP